MDPTAGGRSGFSKKRGKERSKKKQREKEKERETVIQSQERKTAK